MFAGSSFEPESALRSNLEQLFNLFTFYHGSIERVQLVSVGIMDPLNSL